MRAVVNQEKGKVDLDGPDGDQYGVWTRTYESLTPAQARHLALELTEAAQEIEDSKEVQNVPG